MPLVFVYGTLLRGQRNHYWLQGSPFVAAGSTPGLLYDLGRFPGARFRVKTRDARIYGEVYNVTPHVLRDLDAHEGYHVSRPESSFYLRVEVPVFADGNTLFAQAYEWNPWYDPAPRALIRDGVWRGSRR